MLHPRQITQDSDGHMDPCRCLVATLDDDMDACRTCAGVGGGVLGELRVLSTYSSQSFQDHDESLGILKRLCGDPFLVATRWSHHAGRRQPDRGRD